MTKQKVLLLGATGETGGDILDGLLEDGNFEIDLLIRPSSADKPAVKTLSSRGFKIVLGDPSGDIDGLTKALIGYDTVISAIAPRSQLAQLALVDAAAKAGVKRFVPCAFITVCPPSGIMTLRDEKEVVYQRIWYHKLPYTIIDVGFWHQVAFFRVPSGRFDYAHTITPNEIYGTGEVKTLLTDKRDMGRFVAKIIQDERTLNQKVFTWSNEISQNEVLRMIEEKTGEKVEVAHVSESGLRSALARAEAMIAADPTNMAAWVTRSHCTYSISKFIRADNTRETAKYLGYLDARELYPDLKPITFEKFLDELIAGEGKKPYAEAMYPILKVEYKE